MKSPKILFATAYAPFPKRSAERDDADVFYYRNTLHQGLFQMRQSVNWHPLHLIAQNIPLPSTVLENPSFDRFKREVAESGCDIVAFSFTVNLVGRILEMARWIKSERPGVSVILGGYGTAIFKEKTAIGSELEGLADGICQGEGVEYFRRYLREKCFVEAPDLPIVQALLPSENSLFRLPLALFRQGHVIKSLGCPRGCSFCGTSSLFSRGKIHITDARGLHRAVKDLAEACPDITSAVVYDENFLQDEAFFREFKSLMEADEELLARPLSLTVFSSADTIRRYAVEDLLKAGIGMVFIGVESFEPGILKEEGLSKRGDEPIQAVFGRLRDAGIGSLGSLVLGWDSHDAGAIRREADAFAELVPTFYQVVPLHAIPGTPLWKKMSAAGRIPPEYRFEDDSVGKSNIVHPRLAPEDMDAGLSYAYRALVESGGPWPCRLFGVNLRGWLRWRNSGDAALARRARGFKRSLVTILPIAWAGRYLARGKAFHGRFASDMKLCASEMPVFSGLSAVLGAGLVPLLLLLRLFASARHAILPHGDQPAFKRSEYPGRKASS
jgi:haloalkane dehalogenase